MKNSPETLKKRNALRKYWKEITPIGSFLPHIIKVCKDCKEEKECAWSSSFTQTGKPEYKSRCNDCHNVASNAYRRTSQKYKTSRNISQRQRSKEIKQKAVDYLGGKCIRCGYDKCLRALGFHHRYREEKLKSI